MVTTNLDRMEQEIRTAVDALPERVPGYRSALAEAAIEAIALTAEHDEKKIAINQGFKALLKKVSSELLTGGTE